MILLLSQCAFIGFRIFQYADKRVYRRKKMCSYATGADIRACEWVALCVCVNHCCIAIDAVVGKHELYCQTEEVPQIKLCTHICSERTVCRHSHIILPVL